MSPKNCVKSYFKKSKPKTHENESWEFESLNRKPSSNERLPRHPLPVPSTRALWLGTARVWEELETARMHPRSANDVAVNAQERKNTTSDCALNLFFVHSLTANDALKHKILLWWKTPKNSHRHENTTQALLRTSTRIRTHANALVIREIVIWAL